MSARQTYSPAERRWAALPALLAALLWLLHPALHPAFHVSHRGTAASEHDGPSQIAAEHGHEHPSSVLAAGWECALCHSSRDPLRGDDAARAVPLPAASSPFVAAEVRPAAASLARPGAPRGPPPALFA